MTPTITAFEASPDRGRGLARDFPVRWALEEVGQPYEVRLVSFKEMKEPEHLARQPFGQIPTYEEDGLVLRVWECAGQETIARLRLSGLGTVRSARRIDLLERDRSEIETDEHGLAVPVRARGLSAVRVLVE